MGSPTAATPTVVDGPGDVTWPGEASPEPDGPGDGGARVGLGVGVGEGDGDGEAPGEDEDKKGEPFVGRAGQLLTKIIEAIGMTRDQVYIANVIKCRPPGNRDPQDDEIEACTPWLVEQVSLIQPMVIATLGNFATKFVLNTQQGITRMRGRAYPWHGRTVIPTFHPAAILHGGGERSRQFAELREDFELPWTRLHDAGSAAAS